MQIKNSAFQSLNMDHHIWSDDQYNKQSNKPEHQGIVARAFITWTHEEGK